MIVSNNVVGNRLHDEDTGQFTSADLVSTEEYSKRGGESDKTKRYKRQIEQNGFGPTILSHYNNKMRSYFIDDNFNMPILLDAKADAIKEHLGKENMYEMHNDDWDKRGIDLVTYKGNPYEEDYNMLQNCEVIDVKSSQSGMTIEITKPKKVNNIVSLYDGWLIDKLAENLGVNKNYLFNQTKMNQYMSEQELAETIRNYQKNYGKDYLQQLKKDFGVKCDAYLLSQQNIKDYLYQEQKIPESYIRHKVKLIHDLFDEKGTSKKYSYEEFTNWLTTGSTTGQRIPGDTQRYFKFAGHKNGVDMYERVGQRNGIKEIISFDPEEPFWFARYTLTIPREKMVSDFAQYKI